MTSLIEVVLVVAGAVIFLTMIVAALGVIVWSVTGFISATHRYPTHHHHPPLSL
jgi:hypothetical protein